MHGASQRRVFHYLQANAKSSAVTAAAEKQPLGRGAISATKIARSKALPGGYGVVMASRSKALTPLLKPVPAREEEEEDDVAKDPPKTWIGKLLGRYSHKVRYL